VQVLLRRFFAYPRVGEHEKRVRAVNRHERAAGRDSELQLVHEGVHPHPEDGLADIRRDLE